MVELSRATPIGPSAAGGLALGLIVAACSEVFSFSPVEKDEGCGDLCDQLETCKLLPSVLGSDGTGVGETVSARDNCYARCKASSEEVHERLVDCARDKDPKFDWCDTSELVCRPLTLCLMREFPDLPVTGRVTLSIVEGTVEAEEAARHCYCRNVPDGARACPMIAGGRDAGQDGANAGTGGAPNAGGSAGAGGAGGDSSAEPALCRFVAEGSETRRTALFPCGSQPSATFEDLAAGAYDLGIERVRNSLCQAFTRKVVLYAGGTTEVVPISPGGLGARPCEICDDQVNNDQDPGVDCEDPKCAVECRTTTEE